MARARSSESLSASSSGSPNSLAFHIAQFLRHEAVAHAEDVDSSHVTRAPVVAPADDTAVAGRELLFRDERRGGIVPKEVLPELAHRGRSSEHVTIRRRASALEAAIG